ncbi:putative ribonuclease H-like domain-containing protein [Tanacetum coccineum]|uniref:Ribonuclease H-like domain-containing protein n=1 Tax=Tanacetum coccineum TaxID=301880 RepID=A0ABQ5E7U8_9ASTR
MQEELLQFKLQQVWTLMDLPNGKKAIGTKWVYGNKKDERVARIEAIRLFLAYASFKDFVVYQMDVKSAFLYGKIEEDVYVCQPPRFEDPDFPDRVYKVEKALYGLHQAPRACKICCSMANLSRNGSDALTEVHNQDNLNYDLFNQSEQIMTSSEQSNDHKTNVLILSMFEQITTQVTHCNTVNKALTTELDRYKEEVKDLKEKQNVENSFSRSNEQFDEIVRLKQNLFKQVQENDCLMKTVFELKNELKLEENKNIDREIALEKKIKQLDNIIFKRGQSAQTVRMLTNSKTCYDHFSKQAIGFEKPFCLKKARESRSQANAVL